ncbi:ribosome recycling factor-domain-containing protein [Russula earlei]|uniref:Ribosome recycling factor-domain-containing protein n=1 Tax=Russula earlei TaxID=71964 RepID=A0ACC0UKU2_9AGAM|nr:ribosome recycling factor-domain-containing protein [Russula earlei]
MSSSLLSRSLRLSTVRPPAATLTTATRTATSPPFNNRLWRASYGSSSKRGPIATASLTPGSQQTLADPTARDEIARADARMAVSVEWLRREVAQLEARASGRVTPRLLAPVRVSLAHHASPASASASALASASEGKKFQLEELATVGVRDGSTLVVTVFDPKNLKHVQDALYEAKIQGVIPQRVDERTLRIPVPKPTVEARLAAYSAASKLAEETRVQIRRQLQASVKKGKYPRHSVQYDEFRKLQDRHIADVDAVLAHIKRSTGAR